MPSRANPSRRVIGSGRALELFAEVVAAQGGNPLVIENDSILDQADRTHEITADRAGVVTGCHARKVGVGAMRLGAGRERKEDTIDPGVGITLHAKPGESVQTGDPLATLRYRHPARLQEALRVLDGAFTIGDEATPGPLVIDRITAGA